MVVSLSQKNKNNQNVFLVFLVPSSSDKATKHFSQMIKDLSQLYTLHIQNDVPKVANLVEDRAGDTKIFLVVPPELKKNLELDLVKMEARRVKLLKELDKLNEAVLLEETKERNRKKVRIQLECHLWFLFRFIVVDSGSNWENF